MRLAPNVPVGARQSTYGAFATALDPVQFARRVGIEPDAWQADVLRSSHHRLLLNCSRQSGKSTTTAIIGLHRAIFHPGSLVLLLSPSLRQSAELFRTVSRLYGRLGETVPANAETVLRLELANGSRVLSLPASEATIRGYAGVSLLLLDEASRVPDDLYSSVRPMLATTNGRLIAMSTPFGKRGWWSDAWHDGSSTWQRVSITADQCPRISPEFLAEEKRELGEWWFLQEYFATFMDSESQIFTSAEIESAFAVEYRTWNL